MSNLENNKLIAEFMGFEIIYRPYSNGFVEFSETERCDVDDLDFKQWNWLMPVVAKCRNESNAEDNHWEMIYYSLEGCDIDVTYQAVIEFIENKKQY